MCSTFVGSESYRENSNSAPEEGVQAAGRPKIARISAQYKNRIANQRSVCNSERTSSAMDEACRLRRDEGYGACEDEALLFAYFFWRNRKSRSAKQRLQCHCKRGSPVKPDKRADVHPQGVGRIRSAPSSLTAALAIGPYRLLCRIARRTTAAVLPH